MNLSIGMGVILTAVVLQAEGRILRGEPQPASREVRTRDPFGFAQGRLLTRLNCAGFRDDASEKGARDRNCTTSEASGTSLPGKCYRFRQVSQPACVSKACEPI